MRQRYLCDAVCESVLRKVVEVMHSTKVLRVQTPCLATSTEVHNGEGLVCPFHQTAITLSNKGVQFRYADSHTSVRVMTLDADCCRAP